MRTLSGRFLRGSECYGHLDQGLLRIGEFHTSGKSALDDVLVERVQLLIVDFTTIVRRSAEPEHFLGQFLRGSEY